MKVLVQGAAALMGAALVLSTVPAPQAHAVTVDPATTAKINILYFNDFHGRIDGSASKMATTIEQSRAAEGAANTLLLSGGDNVGASLYVSSAQQDNPTLDALNALGVQAAAVGNHEFDRGVDDLQSRIRTRAQFPYLAANVTLNGAPVDKGYTIVTIDGMKVGIIGAVTQETPSLTSPAGMQGVVFTDPVAAVNKIAAQLSDGDAANDEADILLAEYHEGYGVSGDTLTEAVIASKTFAHIVNDTAPQVDAIFNAHTHAQYEYLAGIKGSRQLRPVIQAGSYAQKVGQAVLTVDRATKTVKVADTNLLAPASAADTSNATVAAVAKIESDAKAKAATIGGVVVGAITADVTRAWSATTKDDRAKPSTLGAMVATMYRDATKPATTGGAEIGVTNPGGLRTDLLMTPTGAEAAGEVTLGELAAVQPFANNLWTGDVTGAVFTEILEQQWQTNADGTVPSRPYLALSLTDNVRYTYDTTRPQGQRITGLWFDGKPWAATATHRVAAPIFLLSGGDNFRAFTKATNVKDSGLVDIDAYQGWMKQVSPYRPDYRKAQYEVQGLPTTAIQRGTTVTLKVNDIALKSAGVPQDSTLEVWYGTSTRATAPVTDGSATVSFPIPKNWGGTTVTLWLVGKATGTKIPFQLTLADTAAPVTSIYLTYNVGATVVKLVPWDVETGVKSTMYSLDGKAYVAYTGPISVPGSRSAHTISYYSIDNEGNKEAVRTFRFTVR